MGENVKSCLRRSLFVVGQLCKQFDFDAPEFEGFREVGCNDDDRGDYADYGDYCDYDH